MVPDELNGVETRISEQIGPLNLREEQAPSLFMPKKINQATAIGTSKPSVGRPVVGLQLDPSRRSIALDSLGLCHDVPLIDRERARKHRDVNALAFPRVHSPVQRREYGLSRSDTRGD